MKFSDSLLNAAKGILEAKPRVSFDGDKATVHDKTGKEIKSFNRKDLGGNFRKEADSYMAKNYRALNQAYEPKGESIEEAKQLELPGMGGDKQPELNLKKKDESPIKKVKEDITPDNESDAELIDEKKKLDPVGKEDGDIDNDGDMDKSDDYLHNRRKAIKHAMKKEEVEIEEEFISEDAYEIADLILEYFPKEKIGQTKNYHVTSIDPESGAYKLKHKKTGKKTTITVSDNNPFSRTRHVNRELQNKYGKKIGGADRHAIARHINKHIQHTGMEGSDPKKDKAGTGDVRRMLRKDGESRQSMKEAPTYVPGFIGADGKATSKPTEKDYAANKEYQAMKKKLGDRIPGPPPVKKINKEHIDSILSALQEISKKTMGSYIKKASSDAANKSADAVHQYRDDTDDEKAFKTKDKADKRLKGIDRAINRLAKESIDEENEPSKANGGIAHNCATHVSHEEFGLGQCISGMHTIEENEDGTGYVTHYDVMFKSEEGPFIKESVPVEELEILISEKHMHGKKKTVESNEYTDQLADKIRDVENKNKRKKAEKAYNSGDYEKASKHSGVTYWEK